MPVKSQPNLNGVTGKASDFDDQKITSIIKFTIFFSILLTVFLFFRLRSNKKHNYNFFKITMVTLILLCPIEILRNY